MQVTSWSRVAYLALIVGLLVFVQGCPLADDSGLVEGAWYEVELQIEADNSLYALEIEQEGDDDDDDCEQEGENEGECDDGDDDDADEEEDDEEECEQEGEHEGENEGCDGEEELELEGEISAQVISIAADGLSFELLPGYFVTLEDDADADSLAIADLEVGMWVEVEGEYEDGVFEAEEIEAADEAEIEIEGQIYNVTGSSFSMLGLTISYDSATEIETDDEEEDDDDDDDDEEDDD